MSRILLAGAGPLPGPDLRKVYAPGLRLDAFRRALQDAGHSVYLAEMHFGGQAPEDAPAPPAGLAGHLTLQEDPAAAAEQITAWAAECSPEAAVALADSPSLAVALSGYRGPLHVDYFGHPMAERQQQAHVHDSDEALADQWLHVLPVLLRADRFSVVSPSQRLALIGELGAAGRLNSRTCHHELVDVVPPAMPFAEPFSLREPGLLSRLGVPEDARTILSTGGFNTWFDEETLFRGLEMAMDRDPAIHFIATGGRIEGHVGVVFDQFQARVAQSRFRERFHLVGWVPHRDLEDLMLLCAVAVNCDRWSVEGELGCRNRLLGWLWAGLRVVTTVCSDSTRELVERGHVRPVPDGDPEALALALLRALAAGRPADSERLRQELQAQWPGEGAFQPLLKWLESPVPAPDRAAGDVTNPLADAQRRFHRANEAAELVDRLLGSSAFRILARTRPGIHALVKRLRRP